MNRNQRRAAHGQSPPAGGDDAVRQLLAQAARCEQERRLDEAAHAACLLERNFPPALAEVVTRQPREPSKERGLQESLPRLTAIDDDVSQRVRRQYEENPYPRRVHVAGGIEPVRIDLHARAPFPTAAFTSRVKTEARTAGRGDGYQAIGITQLFKDARGCAGDLGRAGLACAKRKTATARVMRIDDVQTGWSTSDHDRRQKTEIRYPDTLGTMYRLWVRKP